MVKPSNRNKEEDGYNIVQVIKEEHDDGSDDPVTVESENFNTPKRPSFELSQTDPPLRREQDGDGSVENHDDGSDDPATVESENFNTLKRPSFELSQTDPPLRREQDRDGSVEEILHETEAADMEGVRRQATLYEEQEDYGDSKLLTTSPSEDAPISRKVVTHVPESVMKQENKAEKESSIASCDGKKTSEKKTSKEMTPSSPRLSPTSTEKLRNSRLSETNLKSGQLNNSKKKEKIPAHIGKPWVTWLSALFKTSKLLGVLKSPFWLAMIAVAILPHHAAASPMNGHNTYEPGCSVAGSSREDDVLDSLDVQAGLDGKSFNGSGRGYSRVCRDAFHDVCVEHVDLQNNFLKDLPDFIFDFIDPTCQIISVNLSGINFTKFPLALNSSTDIQLLDLSDNQITDIPRFSMNGMTGLSTLNLLGNKNMTQAPEDTFYLMNHSLISVKLKMTQVQHPLVPPPQTMVCTNDKPCNVTHEEGSVWIITHEEGSVEEKKVTYEITPNGTMCEKVKQQLEADYEVLGGSIHCENNILLGTITIVRKSKSDTTTTFVSTQLDPITAYVTRIDNQSDLGTTNVATTGNGQDTGSAATLSTRVIIIVLILVFVVGVGLGAGGMMCYKQHSSKTGSIATQPPTKNHNNLPLEPIPGTSSSSTSQNTLSVEDDRV